MIPIHLLKVKSFKFQVTLTISSLLQFIHQLTIDTIFYYIGIVPGYKEIRTLSPIPWFGGTIFGNSVSKTVLYSFSIAFNSSLCSSLHYNVFAMQP